MARKKTPRRNPSRDQIRVWLSTILSPMLRALDVELQFTQKRNWSFRCDSQDFEYLWPTSTMVAFPHHANAEQVYRYHPSLRTHAAAHDQALNRLRDSCRDAYVALMQSQQFLNLPMPQDTPPKDQKYFAEYVINGLRDIPNHYTYSEFWRTHGAEYLELRADPQLKPVFTRLDDKGNSFRQKSVGFRQAVGRLQQECADEARLAPVDPTIG